MFIFAACSGADVDTVPEEVTTEQEEAVPEEAASEEEAAPEELTKIILSYRDALSWGPIIIAQEEGFFEKHGIEVEFTPPVTTGDAIALMSQGDLDIHPAFLNVALFNAIAQGEPVKIVANKGFIDPEGCAYSALVVNKELFESGEVTSAADLAGRTFGNRSNNFSAYLITKALEVEGLSLADVEMLGISERVVRMEAVAEGAADGSFLDEPLLTTALDEEKGVVLLNDYEIVPTASFAYLIFGKSLLEENPEAGEQFMLGYLEGVRQYNEGKTERNIAILSEATELEPDFLERACWPPISDDLSIDPEYIIDFQNWAVDQGLLDSTVTADEFLDTRFIDFANENLP